LAYRLATSPSTAALPGRLSCTERISVGLFFCVDLRARRQTMCAWS